jgi:valyl-tRNA synthetase
MFAAGGNLAVHIAAETSVQRLFAPNEAQILKLARAEKLIIGPTLQVPKASAKAVTATAEIAVPLEGLIDFDKERERLSGQIAKLQTELTRLNGQLSNADFVQKAPEEKVRDLRERSAEIEQQIKTLNQNLETLS